MGKRTLGSCEWGGSRTAPIEATALQLVAVVGARAGTAEGRLRPSRGGLIQVLLRHGSRLYQEVLAPREKGERLKNRPTAPESHKTRTGVAIAIEL